MLLCFYRLSCLNRAIIATMHIQNLKGSIHVTIAYQCSGNYYFLQLSAGKLIRVTQRIRFQMQSLQSIFHNCKNHASDEGSGARSPEYPDIVHADMRQPQLPRLFLFSAIRLCRSFMVSSLFPAFESIIRRKNPEANFGISIALIGEFWRGNRVLCKGIGAGI